MFKKRFSISTKVFFVLFALAAFLRLYRLQEFATFLGDQGRDAIIIKRIVTLEHLTAIGAPSSIGQVFLGPFYYYLMAPFLALFHFNPVGLAFGVALLSIIGFVACYFIIKKEINVKTALLFCFLLAFSSINVSFSRFAWNPNLLPEFAFFTLYFFYKMMQTKKWFFAVLFGAFFSCSFQLHHLALLMTVGIFLYFLISALKKNLDILVLRNVVLSITGFVVLYSPLILFDLKNCFLNTINFMRVFIPDTVFNKLPILKITCVANNMNNHEKVTDFSTSLPSRFIETITAVFQHTFNTTIPLFAILFLLIVFIVICIYLFKKTSNNFVQLHILNATSFLIFFSVLNSQRHAHYYSIFYYSFFLIIAYMLYQLQKNKVIRFSIVPLLLVVYFFLNIQGYYFFTQQPNNQIHDAERIADSIIQHSTPGKTFQVAPLPIYVTDHHIRYFLEIKNHRPYDFDSPVEPDQLYVMCFYNNQCQIIGNNQWHIAMFKNPKIDIIWKLDIVTIYKLVHEKK